MILNERVVTTRRGAATLASFDYHLDADGRDLNVVEHQANVGGGTFADARIDWTYDAAGRLTGEKYDAGNNGPGAGDYTAGYQYDLANNRKVKTLDTGGDGTIDETTTSTYDADDKLQKAVSSVSGETDDAYDGNGSLKTSTHGGVTDTYSYDVRNRLVGATVGGQGVAYGYDDAGERTSETAGGVTTTLVNDGHNPSGYGQVLEEHQGSATPTTTYLLGAGVLGQANASGAAGYLLADARGSTRLLADAGGNVTGSYHYDAFGTAIGSVAGTRYLFDGQRFDPVLGQYDNRAREYDPTNGRFTSVDPYHGDQDNPLTLNHYVFSINDPVNAADPTGQEFDYISILTVTGIGGALVGAGIGAISGAATSAYLHVVQFQTFDGVVDAAEQGAIYGAIAGAIVGASATNPTALAVTLSVGFGISVAQSIPVLLDPAIRPQTKVAVLAFLALQGTLSRGAIVDGLTRPAVTVPPPPPSFATNLQSAFASNVGQATDGILGGYLRSDGTPELLPFTRGGITGHSDGVAQGVIPRDAAGGFSVIVNSSGQATAVLFRSAINSADHDFYLPSPQQKAIIDALPKAPNFKVLE